MMKKICLLFSAIVVLVALLVVGCGGSSNPANSPQAKALTKQAHALVQQINQPEPCHVPKGKAYPGVCLDSKYVPHRKALVDKLSGVDKKLLRVEHKKSLAKLPRGTVSRFEDVSSYQSCPSRPYLATLAFKGAEGTGYRDPNASCNYQNNKNNFPFLVSYDFADGGPSGAATANYFVDYLQSIGATNHVIPALDYEQPGAWSCSDIADWVNVVKTRLHVGIVVIYSAQFAWPGCSQPSYVVEWDAAYAGSWNNLAGFARGADWWQYTDGSVDPSGGQILDGNDSDLFVTGTPASYFAQAFGPPPPPPITQNNSYKDLYQACVSENSFWYLGRPPKDSKLQALADRGSPDARIALDDKAANLSNWVTCWDAKNNVAPHFYKQPPSPRRPTPYWFGFCYRTWDPIAQGKTKFVQADWDALNNAHVSCYKSNQSFVYYWKYP